MSNTKSNIIIFPKQKKVLPAPEITPEDFIKNCEYLQQRTQELLSLLIDLSKEG